MENMDAKEATNNVLVEYYEQPILAGMLLVPFRDAFHTDYPNLPLAITVYSVLLTNPHPVGVIPISDAERGAEDALNASRDKSNTEHAFVIMDHIATNLRLNS